MRDRSPCRLPLSIVVCVASTLALGAPPSGEPAACTILAPRAGFSVPRTTPPAPIAATRHADLDRDGAPELLAFGRMDADPDAIVPYLVTSDGQGWLAFRPLSDPIDAGPARSFDDAQSGDADGDGDDDLLVSFGDRGADAARFALMLWDGSGRLIPGPALDIDEFGFALLRDFDGDGAAELLVERHGDCWPYCLAVRHEFFEYAGGAWELVWRMARPAPWDWPAAADWDGDGRDDYISRDGDYPYAYLQLFRSGPLGPTGAKESVFLGTNAIPSLAETDGLPGIDVVLTSGGRWDDLLVQGTRKLRPTRLAPTWAVTLPRGVLPEPSDIFDYNGDGLDDLVFQRGTSAYGFETLMSEAPESYAPGPASDLGFRLAGVQDIDGDGVDDAVVWESSGFTFFRGRSPGDWEPGLLSAPAPRDWTGNSSIVAGDLDGDGRDDALLHNYGSRAEIRLAPVDDAPTSLHVEFPVAGEPHLADIDADGRLDLLVARCPGDPAQIAFGLGDGTFGPFTPLPVGTGSCVDLADLDGDLLPDLVVREEAADRPDPLVVTLLQRDGTFVAAGEPFRIAPRAMGLETGDLDGDGRDDLVYTVWEQERDRYRMIARLSAGEAGLGPPRDLAGPREASFGSLALVDLDGDARAEIVAWHRVGWDPVTEVFAETGGGAYGRIWFAGFGPDELRIADLDGDGFPDLANVGRFMEVRFGDGTGRFGPASRDWFAQMRHPAFGDFRRDGTPEPLGDRRIGARGLALNPRVASPRPEDTGPPAVRVVLSPEADETVDPPAFDNRWFVAAAVRDDCGTARPLSLRLDLPLLAGAAPVRYEPAAAVEIRVHERPPTGERELLLLGPDEGEVRALLDRLLEAGGARLTQNQRLRLIVTGTWGPLVDAGPGDSGPARYVVQTLRFEGTRLLEVQLRRPDDDLSFSATGEDHLGLRAETTETFSTARARFCSEAESSVACE